VLASVPFIGYNRTLAHAPGARWLEANVGAERIVLRCNSLIGALHAAAAGAGVAALPCVLAEGVSSLTRVSDEVIGRREAWLVLPRDRQRTPRVRAVVDCVVGLAVESR
jgi:DNA-binding transcriptional LysR family regulator